MFTYFKKYAYFIKTLRNANLSGLLQEYLNYYLENETNMFKRNDPYEKYHMYSYSGALYNVYMKWLDNNMEESIDDMAEIFCRANRYIWENEKEV